MRSSKQAKSGRAKYIHVDMYKSQHGSGSRPSSSGAKQTQEGNDPVEPVLKIKVIKETKGMDNGPTGRASSPMLSEDDGTLGKSSNRTIDVGNGSIGMISKITSSMDNGLSSQSEDTSWAAEHIKQFLGNIDDHNMWHLSSVAT